LEDGQVSSQQEDVTMKVAVFGAAGWVGRAVLENFAGRHEVRAFELNPSAWDTYSRFDGEAGREGDTVYGDIVDFHAVDRALEGMEAVVHLTAYFGGAKADEEDENPFLVNVKGLWNVLESVRRRGLKRVVHVGSCHVQHRDGRFLDGDVRRPDGSLYAVGKRLQEELCRQMNEAHRVSIVVLRPDSIIDAARAIHRDGRAAEDSLGSVCRHDLAEACHRALEADIDFDILHVASHPDADRHCNVARTREVLGMKFNRRIGLST